jgi:hypothetical protein
MRENTGANARCLITPVCLKEIAMPLGKQIADMLSLLRVCIAILLVYAGVFVGVEAFGRMKL